MKLYPGGALADSRANHQWLKRQNAQAAALAGRTPDPSQPMSRPCPRAAEEVRP